MARGRDNASAFDMAARPMLQFIDELDLRAGRGAASLIGEAAGLLDRFEVDAILSGASSHALKPARYGLAVLLDRRARTVRTIDLETWSVLLRRRLFDGRDMSLARIREFQKVAQSQGQDFADLAEFLAVLISRAESARDGHRRLGSGGWGWKIAGFVLALCVGLLGYAGFLELRYHQRISAGFDAEALLIGLDQPRSGRDLVRRLDDMRAAVGRVTDAASQAPLKRALRLPVYDSQTRAEAVYADAVQRMLPDAVAEAIETAIASEGEGLLLYDALRAWSVLTGQDDWTPGYLAGWLEDRDAQSGLAGLAPHVARLTGPAAGLTPRDTELREQARRFAAEIPDADRAWLELLRAGQTRALPQWDPAEQVPGLPQVLLRRSGTPIETALPGLFTQAGWDHARDYGVGIAVQKARAVAPLILGDAPPTDNDTPDLLMDRLQQQTIAAWEDWLADLRVRPFAQRETAIIVSGALARPDNPLSRMFREVWVQVGGQDRRRSHAQQLQLARQFGPLIQYVEQGRMSEISALFAALNVALGAVDLDRRRGMDRLMSIGDRARSITALKAAPRIVVQIAEDVLAQSAAPQTAAMAGGNALTREWQQQVFPACQQLVQGRYPFADGGPDAPMAELAGLLGPQGVLTSFLQNAALPQLETAESPWRWKPEARFEGLEPDSAAFLERAAQISQGLFGGGPVVRAEVTLSALAERGRTLIALGGVAQPVLATGAPVALSWPGPSPEAGIEVSFREGTDAGRLSHQGQWGLFRLIDTLRLRLRDDGARALLDLRSDTGRVFLEMSFADTLNPISVRKTMRGLDCPPNL
ncbi:Intracellular multiplication and macrophage-killing [Paracoccus isoporae]|uniref:Intracellular multiplication and macrophage-killing n=1 Tax=Paracoccus isoporae TaxID=591205 RepID=A0A1G7D6Z4_9RHOB|nr:ImcF-related family protein [Paracoccus isoporae]SDE47332.1 Intracellular multiplication and macrophage-killing [Paracoccus isoporae]